MLNEGNQIDNFISSSGSGTVTNYGSGSGSDFLTNYGSGSGSTRQKVTVPTVPVPQHCLGFQIYMKFGMMFHMNFQVARLGKGSGAHSTRERLIPCMYSKMPCQAERSGEGIGAF
jgi:hypothetical protein